MKNKFENQFNKEFNQIFTPNIDKELLKDQLNIQTSSCTTNNVVFKKKVFVPLSIICSLLLIVLSSLTTWGVTKWFAFNNQTPPVVDEEVDVVKMFEEKYVGANVQLINRIDSKQGIDIFLIHVKSSTLNSIFVYFNKIPNDRIEYTTYKVNVNGVVHSGNACKQGEFLEFCIDSKQINSINLTVYSLNNEIFEFCTNF